MFRYISSQKSFYSACNSIFSHGSGLNEIAMLHLQEVYSLSILMYTPPAVLLNVRQVSELNVCWNMVKAYSKNFRISARTVIDGLGRVDVTHLIQPSYSYRLSLQWMSAVV